MQSRYYNPELGRFINADAFVSTGQGFFGYNMFAYCNNNPLRYIDSHGNVPMENYDNPFAWAGAQIGEWISDIIKTDKNQKDAHGNYTTQAKIKRSVLAVWNSLEASVGIGLGLSGECEVFGVSVELGIHYNPINIEISDGCVAFNHEYKSGMSASFGPFGYGNFEAGSGRSSPTENMEFVNDFYYDGEAFFGAGAYFIAGGSFSVGFDIEQFFNELKETFR